MKKLGILVFIAAVIVGVLLSGLFRFSFGSPGSDLLRFDLTGSINGSGTIAVEKRDLQGFTAVEAGGVFDITVVAQTIFQ